MSTTTGRKTLRERGGALLAVLGFALLALAFVVIAFTESDNQVRQVGLELRQQQSLAACELGFSVAIARLNLDQSPDFDGDLAALQAACIDAPAGSGAVDDNGDPILGRSGDESLPFKDYRDPNGRDDDGDGYADFEEAPSFAEQKALFAKRPNGSFAVRGIKINDFSYKIRVFGVHDRDVRVLEAIVRRRGSPLLGGAAGFFGAEELKIEEDSFLDSYISGGSSPSIIAAGISAQPYNPTTKEVVIDGVATGQTETYAGSNVQVGSNRRLEIAEDSKVIATTVIGEDGEIRNEGTTYAPTRELGSEIADDIPTYAIPAVNNNAEIAGGLAEVDDFVQPTNTGYVLGETGQDKVYVFEKFSTKEDAIGTIRGNVSIYVTEEMRFDTRSIVTLEPGATLSVFTSKEVTFRRDLRVNEGGFPASVQINSGFLTGDLPRLPPLGEDGTGTGSTGAIAQPDGSTVEQQRRSDGGTITNIRRPDGSRTEIDVNREGNGVRRIFGPGGVFRRLFDIRGRRFRGRRGDDDDDDEGDDDDDDDVVAPGDIFLDIGGDDNAAFFGVINAPGVRIIIDRDAKFYGGIRGRRVTLREGGNFHYDESLAGFINRDSDSGPFELRAFKEVR